MPGARFRIRIRGPRSGSGPSSGSGSGTSSGRTQGRSGPKIDEHPHPNPHSRPIYTGSTGGHGVYTSDHPPTNPACYNELKVFVDCINASPNDISVCQETFDKFSKCQDLRTWWYKYHEYLALGA